MASPVDLRSVVGGKKEKGALPLAGAVEALADTAVSA